MKHHNITFMLALLALLLFPPALMADNSPATKSTQEKSVNIPAEILADARVVDGGDTSGAVMFSELPEEDTSSDDVDDDVDDTVTGERPLSHEAAKPSSPAAVSLIGTSAAGFLLDKSVGEMDSNLMKPLNVISSDFIVPVEKNIKMYSGALRKHFSRYLTRSGKYMDMMKGIFRENGLPEDLVFLAMVESGFNPLAYSWARASGPWQFIKGTGKKYGLNVTPWVDERRDPIKSTRAAASYLKDLYDMFGSWALALASYNAGEGNVSRAVLRNGTLDFWELRNSGSLANETKEYVPKFLAAKIIATNPKAYGFGDVEYDQPMQFDEVEVKASTRLEVVAKCCGATAQDIKDLNPELMRWCTPPNNQSYTLRIPKGSKEAFLASYGQLPETERSASDLSDEAGDGEKRPAARRSYHTVKKGETLSGIARKYGMKASSLAKINGIGKGKGLREGQKLALNGSAKSKASSGKGRRGAARKRVRTA